MNGFITKLILSLEENSETFLDCTFFQVFATAVLYIKINKLTYQTSKII